MSLQRTSYLITDSLKFFLLSSVLMSVSSQVASFIGSITVGNFIGPNAISAINTTMPILAVVMALCMLVGTGAGVVLSKALGQQEGDIVNYAYTVSMAFSIALGIVLTIVGTLWLDTIVGIVCPNEDLAPLVHDYLRMWMRWAIIPMIIASVLFSLIRSDGAPHIVTQSMIAGALTDVASCLIMVGWLKMGIGAVAICFALNMTVCIVLMLRYIVSTSCSFRWQWPKGCFMHVMKIVMADGVPIMVSNMLMMLISLVLNTTILRTLGLQGMFIWSVCLQLMMLNMMVLNSASFIMFSIGSLLVGEQEYTGLRILVRKTMQLAIGALLVITLFIMISPFSIARMFGAGETVDRESFSEAMRLFSLLLIPYTYITVMCSLLQVLGHRLMSTVLRSGLMLFMAIIILLLAHLYPHLLWWAFPISAVILLVIQLTYTAIMHHRDNTLEAFTLIPEKATEGESMDFSVSYTEQDTYEALDQLRGFLKQNDVDKKTENRVMLCCEELMLNIVRHSEGKVRKHQFDVHILIGSDKVRVSIKDAGKAFNPIAKEKEFRTSPDSILDEENITPLFGLKLVIAQCPDLTYNYMNGQNTIYAQFNIQQ